MNVTTRNIKFTGLAVAALLAINGFGAHFDPLFQIGRVKGNCVVEKPGVMEPEVGVENRAYPFGSKLIVEAESEVIINLSPSKQVRLSAGTVATLGKEGDGHDVDGRKEILLESGVAAFFFPNEENEIPLTITTSVASCDNLKGRSEITLVKESQNDILTISTTIGELRFKGPQFSVERMKRSSSIEIISSHDKSYTGLTGKSGEFEMAIERGADAPEAMGFRPGARAKIWRRWAEVSNKMAVSVMIAGTEGGVQSSFAYLEGENAIEEQIKTSGEGGQEVNVAPVASGFDDFLNFDAPAAPAGGGGDNFANDFLGL